MRLLLAGIFIDGSKADENDSADSFDGCTQQPWSTPDLDRIEFSLEGIESVVEEIHIPVWSVVPPPSLFPCCEVD
jgi:hypothetical protein